MKRIFKKGIAILLVILCAFNLAVVSFAEETVTSGSCGENATWSFDDATDTLTISGEGEMYDYELYSAPWRKCGFETLIINDGITNVGEHAFYSLQRLRNVYIGESVVEIRYEAFRNSSLLNVRLPKSLKIVDDYAFPDGTGLLDCYFTGDISDWCTIKFGNSSSNPGNMARNLYIDNERVSGNVHIPDGVSEIGDYAFRHCEDITSVVIPDSVKTIGSHAFENCTRLSQIHMGDNVEIIEEYAFFRCAATTFVLPDKLETIGSEAFGNCESLESIHIPNSVTQIDTEAFAGCTNLSSITVGSENIAYSSDENGVLFNKDKTELIRYP